MNSIRAYLLKRLLGGVALILAVASVAGYVFITRSLEHQFDQNLSDRVQGFASILFQNSSGVRFEFSDELMPEYDREENTAYFQLWYDDQYGEVLERSESLGERDLELVGDPHEQPIHWTAPLPDGRTGRYVARIIEVHHVFPEEGPFRPEAENILVVIATGREGLVRAEVLALIGGFSVFLALIALIGILTWLAVSRGLAPANRLARTLDRIDVNHLPEGLRVENLPAELEPMAKTIDALIARVDAALVRERRTSADIAHELRTPISELITVAEVALRNSKDSASTRETLGTVRDVAWRMGGAVSTLLKLARLDMGAETFDREGILLAGVVRELMRELAAARADRGITVENSVGIDSLVAGDREVLRIVVSNLLNNAIHYSRPRATVSCRLERDGDYWRFVVENDVSDLSPEDLGNVTAPFWRKDHSRMDRDRSGLGLALSSALAERTGMRLEFELENGTFRALLSGVDSIEDPKPQAVAS